MVGSGFCTTAGSKQMALRHRKCEWKQPAATLVRDALALPKALIGREETISALLNALASKSPHTAAHCNRVGAYAARLASALDFPEARVKHVERCGLLHDVGKLAIPEDLLEKPGRLTCDEWDLIKLHPVIGASVLRNIPWLAATLPAVAMHHERWDGQGYPYGVAGEAIPLEARIVAVCDAYDTMTSERPYKSPMRAEEAMARIQEGANAHFDPDLVQIFLHEVLAALPHGRILPV